MHSLDHDIKKNPLITDNYIKEWRLSTNQILLYNKYPSLHELDLDWDRFTSMNMDDQRESDWKSLDVWGDTNQTRYYKMKSEFLKNDIDDEIADFTYNGIISNLNEGADLSASPIESLYEYAKNSDILTMIETKNYILENHKDDYKAEVIADKISDCISNSIDEELYLPSYTPYFPPTGLEEIGVSYIDGVEPLYSSTPDNTRIANKPVKEWFKEYCAEYMGLSNESFVSDTEWKDKIYDLYSDFDDLISSDDLTKINNRKQSILDLGWNPEVPFNEYTIEFARGRIRGILKETYSCNSIDISNSKCFNLNEEADSVSNVYIVLLNSKSAKYTNEITSKDFKDIGVSFDSSLKEISVYDYRTNRFSDITLSSLREDTRACKVYMFKLNKSVVSNMKKRIKLFNSYKESLNPMLGSIVITKNANIIKRPMFVCEIFMNNLITLSENDISGAISKTKGIIQYKAKSNIMSSACVYSGSIRDYKIDNSRSKISADKYISLTEAKEFPIEFTKDGDLLISKGKKIDFEGEYSRCHTAMLEYIKSDSIEGMKYCMLKLWYMNILLEELLHAKNRDQEKAKEYNKARAKILNDIKTYMPEILKRDKEFDILKAYADSPFSNSKVKISKSTIKYALALFHALIRMIKL